MKAPPSFIRGLLSFRALCGRLSSWQPHHFHPHHVVSCPSSGSSVPGRAITLGWLSAVSQIRLRGAVLPRVMVSSSEQLAHVLGGPLLAHGLFHLISLAFEQSIPVYQRSLSPKCSISTLVPIIQWVPRKSHWTMIMA